MESFTARLKAVLLAEMLNLVGLLMEMYRRAEQYCRVKPGVV